MFFPFIFYGLNPDGVNIVATRNKGLQYKKSLGFYTLHKVFHSVCILMIIQSNNQGILEYQ